MQAQGCILSDGEQIGNNNRQITFLFNHLEGNAAMNITTWINTYGPSLYKAATGTPETFLKVLEGLYRDQAIRTRPLNILQNLQQGDKESFNKFYPKFKNLKVNAGFGIGVPEYV